MNMVFGLLFSKMVFISNIYYTITILLLQYSIHLNFLPKSRHIAVLMIVIAYVYNRLIARKVSYSIIENEIKKRRFWGFPEIVFSIQSAIILLYTVFITFYRDAYNGPYTTAISTTFNFFVFMVIIPPFLVYIIPEKKKFCEYYINATVIQSLIVFLSFLLPQVREWLMTNQNAEIWGGFTRYGWRILGLGVVGAGGSIYLFAGYVCCIFKILFIDEKLSITTFLKTLMIFFAIALIGRTGFYAATVLSLIYFLKVFISFLNNKKAIVTFIASLLIILTVVLFVNNITSNNSELMGYTIDRLWEIFKEDNTVEKIASQYSSERTPEISVYTLFGSGIIRGTMSNGEVISNDSGYAKRYASIGLIMCIYSYVVLLIYYYRKISPLATDKRRFLFLVVLLLHIIEYKEPFIYMYALPFTIYILAYYENVDLCKDSIIKNE